MFFLIIDFCLFLLFFLLFKVTHPDVGHRLGVFQRQISRWAGKQQTARDAMTKHASWLRKFGQEIQTTRNSQNRNNSINQTQNKKQTRSSNIAAAVLSPRIKSKGAMKSQSDDRMDSVQRSFSNEI